MLEAGPSTAVSEPAVHLPRILMHGVTGNGLIDAIATGIVSASLGLSHSTPNLVAKMTNVTWVEISVHLYKLLQNFANLLMQLVLSVINNHNRQSSDRVNFIANTEI